MNRQEKQNKKSKLPFFLTTVGIAINLYGIYRILQFISFSLIDHVKVKPSDNAVNIDEIYGTIQIMIYDIIFSLSLCLIGTLFLFFSMKMLKKQEKLEKNGSVEPSHNING